MAPPTYNDLGKSARELFRKGYHPGLWQLSCKTMTNSGIEFLTSGRASQNAGKVQGSLQSKYKLENYGLTLTERWNSENWLYGEIMQKDKLAEGLMMAIEATFQPQSGDKDGKFKIGYEHENFNFLSDLNFDPNGPLINASIVLGYQQFVGGIGTTFDTSAGDLKSHRFALGWSNDQTTVHLELKDGSSWYSSLFHKANDQIDVGVEFLKGGSDNEATEDAEGGEGGRSDMTFGVGLIYHLEEGSLIRGKIDSNAELGLGYEQKLRDGITFSVSAVIEGKNLNDGNHKFGVGFSLEC